MSTGHVQRLKGRVAVVTGGGAGIGAAICQRLAKEGARILVADIDEDAAAATCKSVQIAEHEDICMSCQVDVSDEKQVQNLVAKAVGWAGGLDIWVNNAAKFVFGAASTATDADWDLALGVNVKGYAFGIKHASLQMIKQREHSCSNLSPDEAAVLDLGHAIVNVSSISAFMAQPGFVPYSSTKAAINEMTRCCALDLGKHCIRVNAICPGPTLTEGTRRHAASQGKSVEEACKEMTSHMIMPRMGKVEEQAAAVAFLASDDASFITGATLNVDGGYMVL
ncbi:hypothetical protein ABBQ38_002706 [Trebouxia sp. C0009 RCD-2024]